MGIFLTRKPSSHCLKNSSLNITSLYADFLPLATPKPTATPSRQLRCQLHPCRANASPPTVNSASLRFPSLFEREHFSFGEAFPLTTAQSASAFGFASRPLFKWATQLRWIAPSPPPSGRQVSPSTQLRFACLVLGRQAPLQRLPQALHPCPYHTSIYSLKCNTYLLSRAIGYGIQATLYRKVPTIPFITYPFITSLCHTSYI